MAQEQTVAAANTYKMERPVLLVNPFGSFAKTPTENATIIFKKEASFLRFWVI